MIGSTFDNEKAIAAILYISTKVPDIRFHKFFKILYFANLKHIAKYGRPVVNDKIIAMKDGPVFSKTYDILKGTPGAFSVSFFKHIKPEAEPDLDQFSDSDIECLNESIHENKDLSFTALVQNLTTRPGRKPNEMVKYRLMI